MSLVETNLSDVAEMRKLADTKIQMNYSTVALHIV